MAKTKVLIMGAAGRDFHNFNTYFRNNEDFEVVAFTATQIPDIEGRKYPAELAGELYPNGIPIYDEVDLTDLIKKHDIDKVVFSYSDVPHEYVMHKASIVMAAGADFQVMGTKHTYIKSDKPLIAVCATRTGCGKSQTSRKVIEILMEKGLKVVAIRHPMPYGDLAKQKVQRFAKLEDLEKHNCTIEEMEEYEPHIIRGNVIYAGVDYEAILREAENDPDGCDVILWDGGNNDFPFYEPDLFITVADPLRAGNELTYYPGETNFRAADVIVINKIESANPECTQIIRNNARCVNPTAEIVDAASPISVADPSVINGKRVLVVEDGPTLTHGEMKFGAGTVAAKKFGAKEIIDPRPYAVGGIEETFQKYPGIGVLLPAMGYGEQQINDLEETINNVDCDSVVIGTPIDLSRIVNIEKPHTRVGYDLQEISHPNFTTILDKFVEEKVKK